MFGSQCLVCKKFIADPTPIIGTPMVHLIAAKLGEHISEHHPEVDQQLHTLAVRFVGYIRMKKFNPSDPEIDKAMREVRVLLLKELGEEPPALTPPGATLS